MPQKNRQAVLETVAEILGLSVNDVSVDASFFGDLGCDSVQLLDLVEVIESKFGVQIASTAVDTTTTVQDLLDYVSAAERSS
ncbi:MAG: acyl carrier protein [Myxococcales bacterium]|nr:acyl carrier protein [Myxococcales bacterium]